MPDDDNKPPPENRTDADFIAAPPSPCRDTGVEPERYRVLHPLTPGQLEWLKQQRLRVADSFKGVIDRVIS